ncbi:MAG: gliding motility-associated C-terminal domain-containing protein [Bacteroidota bacterium]|nr:gliding motility-associated C-terminal domain-containing protein [Bacteroidota bacterium]
MKPYLFKILSVLLLLGIGSQGMSQYITTIIGNGQSACDQSDAPPLCIPISNPQSVCVAPNDDIYFTFGNAIKKLSKKTGIVTRIAGTDSYGSSGDGGQALNALFQVTKSVRTDKQGNIYVAESSGHRVRRIDIATGIITTIAGTGNPGFSGDGGPATKANIDTPNDLAIDDNGNIYIADYKNNRIRKVNLATGTISTIAGTGAPSNGGDGGPATAARIPYPKSICLDTKGNLYIAESYAGVSCRIRKMNLSTGVINTVAGGNAYAYSGDGGPAVNASLFDPTAVLTDAMGNIYISEYDSRVRKVEIATGEITTVAGVGLDNFLGDYGLAVNAFLNAPAGLAFDPNGDLLICDNKNNRIRKLLTHASNPPGTGPVTFLSASSKAVCNTGSITFTATTVDPVYGISYQWKKNGTIVGNDSMQWTGNNIHPGDIISCLSTYPICNGVYSVQLSSMTVTGINSQPLSVSISADRTQICKNEAVNFTATPLFVVPNLVYQWKVNNINTGDNSPRYSNSSLTNGDIVSCEISAPSYMPCTPGGIANSNAISVSVSNAPQPVLTITASDTLFCAGATISFQASLENAGPSPLFKWKINGSYTGSETSVFTSKNFANNDRVQCEVSFTSGCTTPILSDPIKLSVENPPIISITPADTIVKPGSQVRLQAGISGGYASYTWTPANALLNTNTLTPLSIPINTNTTYTLTAVTAANCSSIATATIKIGQKIAMPTAFSPNADGKNDLFRIPPNTNFQLTSFSIFNNWGERIFFTNNANVGWDGRWNDVPQKAGSYVYLISGRDESGPVQLKGTLILIR